MKEKTLPTILLQLYESSDLKEKSAEE